MTLMMIILAVCGGATLSIQAAINGQLGSRVGVFKSAFLTFSVGALVTALLIFFFEPKQTVTLLDVPKWQRLGAMFGVPYIVIMVLAVQRIGTAVDLLDSRLHVSRSWTRRRCLRRRNRLNVEGSATSRLRTAAPRREWKR